MGNTAISGIYLETEPVDPRDLLSGTYVALNYAISTPEQCRALIKKGWNTPVYVKLEQKGRTAPTASGPVTLYEVSACAEGPDYSGALWVRGTAENVSSGPPRVRYGIERFFINENDPLKDARSGQVVAKVKLDRYDNLRLEKLIKKSDQQTAKSE
jgi:uncharacterized membrane-anchored protein